MSIAVYSWKNTPQCTKNRIMMRAGQDVSDALDAAKAIVNNVKARGDTALIEYAKKFDGACLTPDTLKVSKAEFDAAEDELGSDIKDAIRACARNVKYFHEQQMQRVDKKWMVEVSKGVHAGEQVNPIPSVGLYVPCGVSGDYPSVCYMLATPAVIAGVGDICIVTPPQPDGHVNAATLFTAKLCGVENVYKIGGAGAIAALAYGTNTIPQVSKIAGPGNSYVTAARQIVSSIVDVGMPAGPTDSVVLADENANVHNTALDLLNEAEHGKSSASLLITDSEKFAQNVANELVAAIAKLPPEQNEICKHVFSGQGYGGIVIANDMDEAIKIANDYAPEHILIKTKDDISSQIKNAGEVLIGEYTPFSMGNFGVGVNNVLPTGRWARTYSATTVWDFLKRTSISRLTKDGFHSLKNPVATIAEYEGFPAHTNAVTKRK